MIEPHCRIGRIHFKAHRPREKRKDAKAIVRAQLATTESLRRAVARARFLELERDMFRGLSGVGRGE